MFDREPDICEGGSPTRFGEVATKQDLFLDQWALRKERKTLRERIWLTMKSKDPKGCNPFTSNRLRRARPRGLEVDEGGRYVSSSDKETVTADCVRVVHRPGRAQIRDMVYALETNSVTRKTLEVHAASVHEFFDWSGFC